MSIWRQSLFIAAKDLKTEFRTRQNFLTTLFFAFLVILIFNFAFDPGSAAARESTPAILWVAFLFAGMLSLGQAFTREKEDDCLLGLLMTPVERGVIYIGKFLANLLFILVMEVCILPVFIIFFNITFHGMFALFLGIVLLVDIGFVAVGTLFAAMVVSMRTREVMLPVLLFPVAVPVVIAGVKATTGVFQGQDVSAYANWLKLLGGFDLIFLAVCYYVFKYVVEEN